MTCWSAIFVETLQTRSLTRVLPPPSPRPPTRRAFATAPPFWGLADRMMVPTLFLLGVGGDDHDWWARGQSAASKLPNAHVIALPGLGHLQAFGEPIWLFLRLTGSSQSSAPGSGLALGVLTRRLSAVARHAWFADQISHTSQHLVWRTPLPFVTGSCAHSRRTDPMRAWGVLKVSSGGGRRLDDRIHLRSPGRCRCSRLTPDDFAGPGH